mgnify:CR=1 FL=1
MKTPFSFTLPRELIAQRPPAERDSARLMVVSRQDGSIRHAIFRDLPDYFRAGDALVLNNARVIPARIFARKPTGGSIEVFLLRKIDSGVWRVLVRGGAKAGTVLTAGDLTITVQERAADGSYLAQFQPPDDEAVFSRGSVPLPPYIKRQPDDADIADYQTVFATVPGAVAAPTAGLHFTGRLIDRLREKGVILAEVTLTLGWASFFPAGQARRTPPPEQCSVPPKTVRVVADARAARAAVTAVGTSTVRALETAATRGGIAPFSGETDLFIAPGYRFCVVDRLITNFHLPCSTHLSLVAAFGGTDLVRQAYETAIAERYRFYSYGDAMLIL